MVGKQATAGRFVDHKAAVRECHDVTLHVFVTNAYFSSHRLPRLE